MTHTKNKKDSNDDNDGGTIWYVCKYCKRAFQRGKYLVRHKRQFHPEQVRVKKNGPIFFTQPEMNGHLPSSSSSSPSDEKIHNELTTENDFGGLDHEKEVKKCNKITVRFMTTLSKTILQTSDEEEGDEDQIDQKKYANHPPPRRRLNMDPETLIDLDIVKIATATCPNADPYFWIDSGTEETQGPSNVEPIKEASFVDVQEASGHSSKVSKMDKATTTTTTTTTTQGPKGHRAISPEPKTKKKGKGKKKYECHLCHKILASEASLKIHERRHTGQLPFQCSHCPKTFPARSSRDLHEIVHTGEKSFRCRFCSANFAQFNKLKEHVGRRHTSAQYFL